MPVARVIYHFEDGTWWAESPDVERWSAAAETLPGLIRLVEEGVPFALDIENIEVRHMAAPEVVQVLTAKTAGTPVRVRLIAHQPGGGVRVETTSLEAGVGRELQLAPA